MGRKARSGSQLRSKLHGSGTVGDNSHQPTPQTAAAVKSKSASNELTESHLQIGQDREVSTSYSESLDALFQQSNAVAQQRIIQQQEGMFSFFCGNEIFAFLTGIIEYDDDHDDNDET